MNAASRLFLATVAALMFSLPASAQSDRVLMGTLGDPEGGGPFRIECEPGDFLVGFDTQHTHVIDHIAPICGNKARGGTYGRPWAGQRPKGPTAVDEQLLCPAGSILTILHVFVDNGALVNNVGMTCLNPDAPARREHTNKVLARWKLKNPSVRDRRFLCPEGMVGVGIYGRAGSAIDALGLICGR